ncbi:MAG: hypothetical protein NC299_13700 [Lachnospiraceae bacterium]|nr:hypothetical protein [Ruminococcus sp.]MCM1276389.1 hypothetical protein [Lachnospiraceae bacterium]
MASEYTEKLLEDLRIITERIVKHCGENFQTEAQVLRTVEDKISAMGSGGGSTGGAEVTANPFAVTFGSLDGITAEGVWNSANKRLEF